MSTDEESRNYPQTNKKNTSTNIDNQTNKRSTTDNNTVLVEFRCLATAMVWGLRNMAIGVIEVWETHTTNTVTD